MPKGQLLKRWNDWSAGIGHLVDDGRTPGMYYAAGLLGLRGELRPAPFFNNVGEPGLGLHYYTTDSSVANILIGACLRPATAGTAVGKIGSASTDTAAASATLTFSHNSPTGSSNTCLSVGVTSDTTTVPTGVTYDGSAMTKVGEKDLGTGQATLWRIVAPSTGANNVVVTFAGAHNIAAGAQTYENVHQTTPFGALYDNAGTGVHVTLNIDCYSDGVAISVLKSTDVVPTVGSDQTALWDVQQSTNVTCAASEEVVDGVFLDSGYHFQYFFDEVATSDATVPFLYYMKNSLDVVHATSTAQSTQCWMGKVILSNTNFGDNLTGAHKISVVPMGQPAKYQGSWHFPIGNDQKPRSLTTIGTSDISGDTLSVTAASFVAGADHLAQLNHQLVGVVEDGTNPGGVRILKLDGTATTDADWGSDFQTGDKDERVAGIRSLAGLTFVLNVDGLYSFNSKGRSGLVFEDFRHWRNVFKNLEMKPWRTGLLIPHPSGLLFYVPGELPVNVGVDSNRGLWTMPPSGPTEIHQGLYHSTAPIGDYVYGLYQPDPSSTSLLVLCSYPAAGDPRELVHQGLGTASLNALGTMQNCYVSTRARPIADTHVTPTFFFGNGPNLSYAILDPRASPFRSRADTHRVNISADAYMSELRFTEPVDLTEIIVHTSADMASGDEFQVSLLTNGTGNDIDIGPPCKGAAARHRRKIDRAKGGKNVTSLVLHVGWVATSTSDRVPPVIQSIELYGNPSVGEVE